MRTTFASHGNDHGSCKTAQQYDSSISWYIAKLRKIDALRGSNTSVGKLSISELFFEVPTDHSKPEAGNLKIFARSVERFEKPVDATKKDAKQPPWRKMCHCYVKIMGYLLY